MLRTVYRIPNGQTLTDRMSPEYVGAVVMLFFYDAGGVQVTPVGRPKVNRSMGSRFVRVHQSGQDEWKFNGTCEQVQLDLTGVSGYTTYDCYVFRSASPIQFSPDEENATFYLGREFRSFFEFSTDNGNAIPAGQRVVIRATLNTNTELRLASVELDGGTVRIRSFVGGTPAGTFSAMPTIRANAMTTTPAYTAANTFEATAPGVSPTVGVTGGVSSDVVRAKTANASGQTSSVSGDTEQVRGLPPGVVLILIESTGVSAAEGVFRFRWTERS